MHGRTPEIVHDWFTPGSKMSMIRTQRWSEDFSRGSTLGQKQHAAERSSEAFSSIADAAEKVAFTMVYDSSAPWFCSGTAHASPHALLLSDP